MMRSLYSAVSGLKTHQTKMDVIGNNIANVNTVAFKASKTTFQDILYQTTSQASGANQEMGTGGVNQKQIGLGVGMASTKITITSSGAAESTGDPFDIRLTDANSTNFFVVNNGSENLFTRSGSFYVDGAGNDQPWLQCHGMAGRPGNTADQEGYSISASDYGDGESHLTA